MRMRRRRVERCLLRAAVAIEAGVWDDAREALEEAGRLQPAEPEVHRLTELLAAAESAPLVEEPSSRLGWLAGAAVLIVLSGLGGWLWTTEAMKARLAPRAHLETASPAPQAPERLNPSSVKLSETAVQVPLSAEPAVTVPEALATTGTEAPANSAASALAVGPAGADRRSVTAPVASEVSASALRQTDETESGEPRRSLAVAVAAPPVPEPLPATPAAAVPGPEAVALPSAAVDLSGAATAPVPAPPSPPRALPESDERLVRAALGRYEAAYGRLDAAAARAVWPSVDQRALARAFDGLEAQNVSLGRCDIRVSGAAAQVDCNGTARWTPKVGGGQQSAARQWRFDLQNSGGAWVITQADVR